MEYLLMEVLALIIKFLKRLKIELLKGSRLPVFAGYHSHHHVAHQEQPITINNSKINRTYGFLKEGLSRRAIKDMFDQYVPPASY